MADLARSSSGASALLLASTAPCRWRCSAAFRFGVAKYTTTVPRPSDGYGFTSRAAGARLDARSFGLGSMLGGRDATTAAAPISRPAGGI